MDVMCIKCKGRRFCGKPVCSLYAKSQARFKVADKLKSKDFFGESPAPFIGHAGYPNVYVGMLTPPEHKDNAWEYDAPRHWAKNSYDIGQVIGFRSELVNSRFKSPVMASGRMLEIISEIGMASKPVELEVNLKDKPHFSLNLDPYTAPMGPSADVCSAKITSNPKVDQKVEKIVSDTDMLSKDAMVYLYRHGYDENFISKILSVANLGIMSRRKLVPTRWSITASDDTLGNTIIEQIRQYPESEYRTFFGSFMGNYYLIMMFPNPWSYELFESYMPRASWNTSDEVQFMTDYEPISGRKQYAYNCAGGYYAARLPILERLADWKKQSSVLALRFITEEYYTPLGVWVVREAVRKTMDSKPLEFSSLDLMLKYAKSLVQKKFGYDLSKMLDASILLKGIRTQTKLSSFF